MSDPAFRDRRTGNHRAVTTAPDTSTETTGRREGRPATRAAWLVFGLALFAFKVYAFAGLFHDGRVVIYVIFGFTALHGFYRGRPLTLAFSVAVLVAVAVRVHPVLASIGVGAATFLGLGAVCFIGALLANRLDRQAPGFGGGWL